MSLAEIHLHGRTTHPKRIVRRAFREAAQRPDLVSAVHVYPTGHPEIWGRTNERGLVELYLHEDHPEHHTYPREDRLLGMPTFPTVVLRDWRDRLFKVAAHEFQHVAAIPTQSPAKIEHGRLQTRVLGAVFDLDEELAAEKWASDALRKYQAATGG